MDIGFMRVPHHKNWQLKDHHPDDTNGFKSKEEASDLLDENTEKLTELQDRLYAENKYGFLLIIQGMDTAGKDGLVKHVMSCMNPLGTQAYSFKQPSSEELDHDYLWRIHTRVPERGRIGIFNRSHYEEVLVTRVHNLVEKQSIPAELVTQDIWKQRFRQIREFENYLTENGIAIVKFFLHLSKEEQKQRFLKRIENPAKNWKFSEADIRERGYWDVYQKCYEDALRETSTENAPWYVLPADSKWFTRYAASEIILQHLEKLNPQYPTLPKDQLDRLDEHKQTLLNEK